VLIHALNADGEPVDVDARFIADVVYRRLAARPIAPWPGSAAALVVVARLCRLRPRGRDGDLPLCRGMAGPVSDGWDGGTPDAVTPRQAAISLVVVLVVWALVAVALYRAGL
jgi:hypothetical protein